MSSPWRGCAPHPGSRSCTQLELQTPLRGQPNSEELSREPGAGQRPPLRGPVTRSASANAAGASLRPGERSVRARQTRADAARAGAPARPRCPARAVRRFRSSHSSPSLPRGLRIAAGMKLVPVALLCLGSLAFLGADTAQLDVASEFRKK